MLDLAQHYDKGYVFLKDIAKRQEISQRYLEKIISLLKTAGLVKSSRGAYGGYVLSRKPTDITLGEIMQTLEGDLSIVECVDSPGCCSRVETCMTRDIWKDIKEKPGPSHMKQGKEACTKDSYNCHSFCCPVDSCSPFLPQDQQKD